MTTAKPPARYGAVWGARAGGFALPSYTISWDTTLPAYIAMLAGIAVALVAMRFLTNMEIKVECGGDVCVIEDPHNQ